MARVYVSSTIADLRRERQAVMDWLVAAGHQVVHSYRPNSDTVRDSCLDDVVTCDLYVLILGHRYGFVPVDDNPGGLSITHLEFRLAGQADKPRVALLRMSIPDERLSDIDDPQKWALVRAFRAEVAREVRAVEFSDQQALILGLSTGVQAELAKQPTGEVAAGRLLRLAPRPGFLAGRDELLAELEARLAEKDGAGPRTVALTGLGGAGKTSVAVEYAHRHLAEFGVSWQLAAEDAAVLAAGFAELAAQLGTGGPWGGGDPVPAVHAALATSPSEWLLIFDNALGLEPVQRFLPPAGRGRVLITSQNAVWPPGQAVPVPMLGTEDAAGFLMIRTGEPDAQAAAALAMELGGLPLALEQAAAYIETAGTTLAGYLAVFLDRRADLLARGDAAGHPGSVAATLGLALSRLEADAPAAAELLRLLACLAPEPVPLILLLSDVEVAGELDGGVAAVVGPLLGDSVVAGDAIAALRRYSLVTPAGDGLVLVHRLVQAITLAQASADEAGQWEQAAAALVEAAIPADTDLPAAWPVCAALLPHGRAVLDLTSDGMWRIAQYLGYSGRYQAAHDLWRLIADAYREDEAYGPEHPDTLVGLANLAHWTGEAGDAAGARDQSAALLPVMERVLSAEHPDTLVGLANLAHWTGEAGDVAGARDQFAALLPVMERVLGAEHQETLIARASLARWTGEAGDVAGAWDQSAALLPVMERVLGAEHPDTLVGLANLARWTGEAGDVAGARGQFAALLPVMERVLGAEHPDTLVGLANLARWTGEAGDVAGARDQFAALLPVMERVLGAEHQETLIARASLARWTGDAGGPAEARNLLIAVLPVRERVLGAEHREILTARASLARWTGEAGDVAGARDQSAALLPVMERVLGAEHQETLSARASLARWTGEAGDVAGARDQFAALLPVMERVLGAEHQETLIARASLARWTGEAGDVAGARDQFAALLPDMERVLGHENIESLRVRAGDARWTGEAGDPAGARNLLIALLPDVERVLGAGHPETLTVALGETLTSGNVLLVGGPDIPVARHAPGRTELLRELVKRTDDQSISNVGRQQILASLAVDNLDQVARLLDGIRDGLPTRIAEAYAAPSSVPAYDALAQIAFTSVINMSWDSSLLDAFRLRSPVVIRESSEEVLTAAKSQEFAFTWFAGDPNHEQIAIGPKEVRARLLANETLRRFLTGSVQSSSLLFLGVRASDIIDFFDVLTASGIGMSPATTPLQRHFAVCAIDELWEVNRSQLRDKFGVELIGYNPEDAGALTRIIQWLLDVSRPYTVPTGKPVRPGSPDQVLSRVTLTNIGAFERLDLEMGEAWNLLLGANGCGKTTLLRAVALGLCGDHTLALEAGAGLLRTGCDQGLIELQVGPSRFRTELDRTPDTVRVRTSSLSPLQQGSWAVLGFPALRGLSLAAPSGISHPQAPEPRVEDLLPLLRNQVDTRLDDIKQWIINVEARARQTGDERERQMLDRFFDILRKLTPGSTVEFESVDQASWEVWVRTDDGVVSIDQLSQGMNSIIAWVGTLLQRMYDIYRDSDEPATEPAFVLIDEVDAHLHPTWQRLLPGLARNHFPRVQFLATSHSPLVAGSLRRGELFVAERVLRTSSDGTEHLTAMVTSADVDPEGLRADQVLTSPLFGLMTSRSPDFGEKVERYSQLITAASRTPEEEAEMQSLKAVISASYRDGETAAERDAQASQEVDLAQTLAEVEPNEQNVAALRRLADALGEAGRLSEP